MWVFLPRIQMVMFKINHKDQVPLANIIRRGGWANLQSSLFYSITRMIPIALMKRKLINMRPMLFKWKCLHTFSKSSSKSNTTLNTVALKETLLLVRTILKFRRSCNSIKIQDNWLLRYWLSKVPKTSKSLYLLAWVWIILKKTN